MTDIQFTEKEINQITELGRKLNYIPLSEVIIKSVRFLNDAVDVINLDNEIDEMINETNKTL